MSFEPDFNELINEQPIFYAQIKAIQRLTNLPIERIYSFSASEATSFLNTVRAKKARDAGWGLTREENRLRKLSHDTVQVIGFVEASVQGVSATIVVLPVQTKTRKRSSQ